MNAVWRDPTRIPRGMAEYGRWWTPIPEAPSVSPSDLDGYLHSRHGDRFLLFEFKPAGAEVGKGQAMSLLAFSRKPGVQCLVVFDPMAHDESRSRYSPDLALDVDWYRNGAIYTVTATVQRLVEQVHDWYRGDGLLVNGPH